MIAYPSRLGVFQSKTLHCRWDSGCAILQTFYIFYDVIPALYGCIKILLLKDRKIKCKRIPLRLTF